MMLQFSKKDFQEMKKAGYVGKFENYHGNHPEWKGRTTVVVNHPAFNGTALLIEGVSFEII